jgi:hypothetical protein
MAAVASNKQLSDQDRARIIEKARVELPDLDKKFKKAVSNLERISEGLRPKD